MEKTKGLIAAPPTGFKPDGSANTEIIPLQAKNLHDNGVVGAFVNGTTGEGLSLTVDERMANAEQWVKSAPPGFKVIIHVAHTCSVAAGELAAHAAKIGADGIAEIGPVFFKPKTVEQLAECAANTAAHAPEMPYYYYHLPAMSGVNFPILDFLRTAEPMIPNLRGVKFTYENLMDYAQCVAYGDGRYDVLFGRDEILLSALALGAKGAVGSTYNIMAPLYNRIITAFEAGDLKEARRLQLKSMEIIGVFKEVGPVFYSLKQIMLTFGLDLGSVRAPLIAAPKEMNELLMKRLDEVGFKEFAMKPVG